MVPHPVQYNKRVHSRCLLTDDEDPVLELPEARSRSAREHNKRCTIVETLGRD